MKVTNWLVAVCVILMFGNAQAEPTRNFEIEKVIGQQIEAFQVDDFDAAFKYATPGIQKRFESPEKFALVVVHSYPMVWRPIEVQYLSVEHYSDYSLQKVMITDRNKTLHILVYEMVPIDQSWRIGGVQIVRQPKSDT